MESGFPSSSANQTRERELGDGISSQPNGNEANQTRCQCWKEKLLTRTEKEILIKAVAQCILTYSMSYFLLPISFVMILLSLWLSFGGVLTQIVIKSIG